MFKYVSSSFIIVKTLESSSKQSLILMMKFILLQKNKVENKVTFLNAIISNNKVSNSSTKVTKALVDMVEIKSGAQQQVLTATQNKPGRKTNDF